jgi:hypothetical protein
MRANQLDNTGRLQSPARATFYTTGMALAD